MIGDNAGLLKLYETMVVNLRFHGQEICEFMNSVICYEIDMPVENDTEPEIIKENDTKIHEIIDVIKVDQPKNSQDETFTNAKTENKKKKVEFKLNFSK